MPPWALIELAATSLPPAAAAAAASAAADSGGLPVAAARRDPARGVDGHQRFGLGLDHQPGRIAVEQPSHRRALRINRQVRDADPGAQLARCQALEPARALSVTAARL